jgi:arylsulfatase A-like enzyme
VADAFHLVATRISGVHFLPAATVSTPVLTVDLAPTLAALLAVPTPDDLAGHPLPTHTAVEVE